MRKQIAAANWKMNCTKTEAEKLLSELLSSDLKLSENNIMVLSVPYPYLMLAKEYTQHNPNIFIAAQNCHQQPFGAYTGEISAPMLKSIDTDYVVLGHSERREYFNESNQLLADKINIVLANNLMPIFCCGEPLQIREADTQNDYVQTQIAESLFHLTESQVTGFVIAYEPIWAIGTGKTASSHQAEDMHAHIRNVLAEKYSQNIANTISILYGGSVKANNATEIFGMPNVDGGLVGGASLIAADFVQIVNALKA